MNPIGVDVCIRWYRPASIDILLTWAMVKAQCSTADFYVVLEAADPYHETAAYLGVVPVEHQSGGSVNGRPRLSKSGDSKLRAKLYMAAMVAAMRKLVHICFGVLKHQTEYSPKTV
jgi:hypothetical protein